MQKLNVRRVGLVLGSVSAIIHALWALLVWLGVAESFIKWVMGLHFISEPVVVRAFSFGNAILLIVVAFLVASIIGCLFATLWNCIKR